MRKISWKNPPLFNFRPQPQQFRVNVHLWNKAELSLNSEVDWILEQIKLRWVDQHFLSVIATTIWIHPAWTISDFILRVKILQCLPSCLASTAINLLHINQCKMTCTAHSCGSLPGLSSATVSSPPVWSHHKKNSGRCRKSPSMITAVRESQVPLSRCVFVFTYARSSYLCLAGTADG